MPYIIWLNNQIIDEVPDEATHYRIQNLTPQSGYRMAVSYRTDTGESNQVPVDLVTDVDTWAEALTNEAPDSGFEHSVPDAGSGTVSGWSIHDDDATSRLAVDQTISFEDGNSLRITAESASTYGPSTHGEPTAVIPGEALVASGWLRTPVEKQTQVVIHWLDNQGVELSTSEGAWGTVYPLYWTRVSTSATAPDNAAWAYAEFYIDAQVTGEIYWLDDAMISRAGAPAEYGDGDDPNWRWNNAISEYLSSPSELTALDEVQATDVWAHSALIQWKVDPAEGERTVTIQDGIGATLAVVDKWRGCYRLDNLSPNTSYTYSLYQALTNDPAAGISPATPVNVLTSSESWLTGMTNYVSSPSMEHNGLAHDIAPWTKLAEDNIPADYITTTDTLSVVGAHSIAITGRSLATPTGISSKTMNGQLVYAAVPYVASCWFRATEPVAATVELVFLQGENVVGSQTKAFTVTANRWMRLSVTATAPVTADNFFMRVYTPQHAYQTYYFDGGMIVQNDRIAEYGDGTSPNWTWVDDIEGGQSVHGEAIPPFPLSPENFRAEDVHYNSAQLVWDKPDTSAYDPTMTINARVQMGGNVIYDDTARDGGPVLVENLSQETAYEATCYFYTPDYGPDEKTGAPASCSFTTPFRYWPAGLVNHAAIPSFNDCEIDANGTIAWISGPSPAWTVNTETNPNKFELPNYVPSGGPCARWVPQSARWGSPENALLLFPIPKTGIAYTASAHVFPQDVPKGHRLTLDFMRGTSGDDASQTTNSDRVVAALNTWTRLSVSDSAPSDADTARIRVRIGWSDDLQQPGERYLFDRIMLTEGSQLWPYADPDMTPGWMWQEKTGGTSEFLLPEYDEFFRNGDNLYFLTAADEPTLDTYAPNRQHEYASSTELGTTEGSVLRLEGFNIFTGPNVAYEEGYVYQLAISMRQVVEPDGGQALVYVGFCGVAEDGETLISSNGGHTYAGHFYCAYSRSTIDTPAVNLTAYGYKTGYMSGTEAPISAKGESPDQFEPLKMYEGTKYVRPMVFVNYRQPDGIVDVDRVTVTRKKIPVLDITPENFRAKVIQPTQITYTWDINGEADDTLMARILINDEVMWDGPAAQGDAAGATVYSLTPETAYTATLYLYTPGALFTGEVRSPEVTAQATTNATRWPQGLTNWMEYGVFTNQAKASGSNFKFANADGEITWFTEQLDFVLGLPVYADVGKVAQMKKATNHYTTDNYLESQTLIAASAPLTFSMYMYPQTAAAVPLHSRVNWTNTNGDTVSTSDSATTSAPARAWQRVTQTTPMPPDGAVNAQIEYAYTNKSATGNINESALLTRAMATYGSTLYDYGDPYCEPGWFWTQYPDGASQYVQPLYDEYFLNDNLLYFYKEGDFVALDTTAPNRSHSFVSSNELGTTQGSVLRLNQWNCFDGPLIPYEDGYVYQVAISMRQVTAPSGDAGLVYTGFTGVAADGVTRINRNGVNAYDSQMYCAYSRVPVEAPLTRWTNYGYAAGYASGTSGTPTIGQSRSQYAPTLMYTGTKFIRPTVIVNYYQASGVVEIDRLTVTRRPI